MAREIAVVNDEDKEVINLETYKPRIAPGDKLAILKEKDGLLLKLSGRFVL